VWYQTMQPGKQSHELTRIHPHFGFRKGLYNRKEGCRSVEGSQIAGHLERRQVRTPKHPSAEL
jgi:hypothetical protein